MTEEEKLSKCEYTDSVSGFNSEAGEIERNASSKKKRTPRASKKELDSLKSEFSSMNTKMDNLISLVHGFVSIQPIAANLAENSSIDQQTDLQFGVDHDNVTYGERSGTREIDHNNVVVDERCGTSLSRDDDAISLQPGQQELKTLLGETTEDTHSIRSLELEDHNSSEGRFTKYSSSTNKLLTDLFGEDALPLEDNKKGITLDDSQLEILKQSWRSEDPSKITAYKDSYKRAFPVNEEIEEILRVPSLDSMVDSLLFKRHGVKAGRAQSLHTQPLRALEKIGYQGQFAARMGIIVNIYMQRALGNLLSLLQGKEVNMDLATQHVRDIFAMSNRSLDQMARCGALHHLVRRRATMADTGLNDLRDVKNGIWELPLTHDGVFGIGLEKKLKERSELNKQISDLLPEVDRKRKFPSASSSSSSWKRPRYDDRQGREYQRGRNTYFKPQSRTGNTSTGSYTIPKFPKQQNRTSTVSSFRGGKAN